MKSRCLDTQLNEVTTLRKILVCGSNVAETSNSTTRVSLIPQHWLVYLSDVFNKHSHECIDKSSICVM